MKKQKIPKLSDDVKKFMMIESINYEATDNETKTAERANTSSDKYIQKNPLTPEKAKEYVKQESAPKEWFEINKENHQKKTWISGIENKKVWEASKEQANKFYKETVFRYCLGFLMNKSMSDIFFDNNEVSDIEEYVNNILDNLPKDEERSVDYDKITPEMKYEYKAKKLAESFIEKNPRTSDWNIVPHHGKTYIVSSRLADKIYKNYIFETYLKLIYSTTSFQRNKESEEK